MSKLTQEEIDNAKPLIVNLEVAKTMGYKVIFIPELGREAQFEQECETAKEAEIVLKAIANYTLLLHKHSCMHDSSNIGMVVKKDEYGDWVEIDEDEIEI